MPTDGANAAAGILPAIMFLAMLTAWVIAIVALWRGMRAHESIAESLSEIAENGRAAKPR